MASITTTPSNLIGNLQASAVIGNVQHAKFTGAT
jgi:hypothetical protein